MTTLSVKSNAFEEGEMIPARHTCDGEDLSPQLSWSTLPGGTESIAVISDDPDAPGGTWIHWVIYNIPAKAPELPEGIPTDEKLPGGAVQGKNSWGTIGYRGPCPPGGTHRYYFRLYALDTVLPADPGTTKKGIIIAMEGHILGKGQLMGRYTRE